MSSLFWRAYAQLLALEVPLQRGQFSRLYETVRQYPLGRENPTADSVPRVCEAIDQACTWYVKQVLCLQRSAAIACLLKRAGVRAELVIGAQFTPFRAHAWVEVAGSIVNDKPYVAEIYSVLVRC
jgi:hypothetical protein